MGRSNIEGARIRDSLLGPGNRYTVANMTLSGTTTLQSGGPQMLFIDPGGAARTLKLWASPKVGDYVWIVNTADAAEVITVQDSAGAALSPACTPTQNEIAFLVYTGATLGWRQMVGLGA